MRADPVAWDDERRPPPPRDNVTRLPLRIKKARLPDPTAIPPRRWLYGHHLLHGFVTLLIAPGGAGKTQLAMAIAVALAANKSILGHRLHHRTSVWYLNLEDPLDEMDRRLAALMIKHKIKREQLENTLFMNSGREHRVCMVCRDADGQTLVYPDRAEICAAARAHNIGLIVVDPFVKSHELAENSNEDMDRAVTAWAQVAEETGASILLVHHVRKGAVVDVDAARGAKALTDASRAAFLLQTMTPEEQQELGNLIQPEERWEYVRLDDAKANMVPHAASADWFRMHTIELGNATDDYPAGDRVAALAPWRKPGVFETILPDELNRALDRIAEGPGEGQKYTATQRGRNNDRWAGQVLIEMFGIPEKAAAKMLGIWLGTGLLREIYYHDPVQRKPRTGLVVTDSQRPT